MFLKGLLCLTATGMQLWKLKSHGEDWGWDFLTGCGLTICQQNNHGDTPLRQPFSFIQHTHSSQQGMVDICACNEKAGITHLERKISRRNQCNSSAEALQSWLKFSAGSNPSERWGFRGLAFWFNYSILYCNGNAGAIFWEPSPHICQGKYKRV